MFFRLCLSVLLGLIIVAGLACAGEIEYEKIIIGGGRELKWSPDGKYLAFLNWPDGKGVVNVWEVATGEVRQIGPAPIHRYEWLTADRFIFIEGTKNRETGACTEICTSLSLDGKTDTIYARDLPCKGYRTTGRLVKLSNGQVLAKAQEKTDIGKLARSLSITSIDTSAFFVVNNDPAWARHWGIENNGDLYLVRSDGSMHKRITVGQGYILPSLSPDGKYICGQGGGATVFDHEGRIVGKIQGAEGPTWFSCSERLVYFRCTYVGDPASMSEADIFVADITGENEIQITNTPDVVEVYAKISPDLSMIACIIEGEGIAILKLKERL